MNNISLNTPFSDSFTPEEKIQLEILWNNCFKVLVVSGKSFINSFLYLNEKLENIFINTSTDFEVYEIVFKDFNIKYKENKEDLKDTGD